VEARCSALERSKKHPGHRLDKRVEPAADDFDLMCIRNVADEPEFEYWGRGVTVSLLNERTHKLERKTLPHSSGRMKSVVFGWVYRGQFDSGKMHGRGGVVWSRVEVVNGELRNVSETYIGQWEQGRREGIGAFMRSDGTSDQGIWKNNNLEQEFVLDFQQLLCLQAAVIHAEAIATRAEAHVNATAAKSSSSSLKTIVQSALPSTDDADEDAVDCYSSDYMTKLMELLITKSQEREAVHLAQTRDYEAERKRAEDEKLQETAAFEAHAAALAASSGSDDDGPAYCTLGTAFFADRVYYGDSPVNVGIEFDRNSRPSTVKEVLLRCMNIIF
jgi:hypothetical protein